MHRHRPTTGAAQNEIQCLTIKYYNYEKFKKQRATDRQPRQRPRCEGVRQQQEGLVLHRHHGHVQERQRRKNQRHAVAQRGNLGQAGGHCRKVPEEGAKRGRGRQAGAPHVRDQQWGEKVHYGNQRE